MRKNSGRLKTRSLRFSDGLHYFSFQLERVLNCCSHTTRRAVNVNIRHGAVAFVEHVFKVQTDAGGFADFVMRSQIQRSVGALG